MWKNIIQSALPPNVLEQRLSNVSVQGWLTRIAGPCPGGLWLSMSGVGLENLHFWLVCKWCWCCWSRDHSLRSAVRASLVAQWLRIRLPRQGTRVRALVREDPTCRGATKPMRHTYRACALEPMRHNYWACVPRTRAPQQEKPPLAATRESLRTATKTQRSQK